MVRPKNATFRQVWNFPQMRIFVPLNSLGLSSAGAEFSAAEV